jgi:hypothetical protein
MRGLRPMRGRNERIEAYEREMRGLRPMRKRK